MHMLEAKLERPKTLREFLEMNNHIYFETNKKYTDLELICRIGEEAAEIMELARKDRRKDLPKYLARIFSWTCSAVNRLDIDLQEALWHKYPGVCSYCLRDANCMCSVEHPSIPDKENILRRLRRERHGREPQSLKEHQELHRRLYGKQNERIMLIQTVAHLSEEAGEVSKAFRHKKREELSAELADVVSWIFAGASRLEIDFEETYWQNYPYECETCRQSVCDCKEIY